MSKEAKALRLIAEVLDTMMTSVLMPPLERGKCMEKMERVQEILHTDQEA